MQGWLSILIMIALGAGFALIAVLLSSVLGPSKPSAEKSAPYECGMPPVGDARERQSVKFYLVAMIFLLFDIEIAFLYPWAMALRDLGWNGFLQVVLFMLLLLADSVTSRVENVRRPPSSKSITVWCSLTSTSVPAP